MRLKLFGRARTVGFDENPALIARLALPDYRARIERGIVIEVEGADWNCPQHITPRFTEGEIRAATAPLREEVSALRARLAELQQVA